MIFSIINQSIIRKNNTLTISKATFIINITFIIGIAAGQQTLVVIKTVTADALAPVQQKFHELLADKAALEAQMRKGAEEAAYYARKTLSKVQKKLGFVPFPRG